jgi:hypothetical protein
MDKLKPSDLLIKPCPFCGAKANAWEWNGGARVDCSRWRVTDGKEHYVGVGGKTLPEAIKEWNKRYGVDTNE